MSSQAAATYHPDYQVIRLKEIFEAFCDPDNPQGFTTPHQFGFFVHEWMHFLQNTSTVHGITAFAHAVVLWTNIRWATDNNGLCAGSASIKQTDHENIQKQFKHRYYARSPKENSAIRSVALENIKFLSCDTVKVPIDDDPLYMFTELVCDVAINGADPVKVSIGSHEIMESAAYMLEEKFLAAFGEKPLEARMDPYQMVRGLAATIAPDLPSDLVLKCAIYSLQDRDPAAALFSILMKVRTQGVAFQDIEDTLVSQAREKLNAYHPEVEKTLQMAEGFFPLDEPLARAVKRTTAHMRTNYSLRIEDPFFEFDILQGIVTNQGAAIERAIEKYGVGVMVQERFGDPDGFQKDLMYDFRVGGNDEEALCTGRRMMHASFAYIFSFFKRKPDRLEQPTQWECPFYTSCGEDFRRDNQQTCKNTPWVTKALPAEKLCFFGRAIIGLGDPAQSPETPPTPATGIPSTQDAQAGR